MDDVRTLIRRLEDSMRETIVELTPYQEAILDERSRHSCARNGSVWDLLAHNVEHDREHWGQIVGIRGAMGNLQRGRDVRMLAELYVARAQLIAALFGLSDEDLDRVPEGQQWSIRQAVEHLLFWERDSIDDVVAQFGEPNALAT